MILRVYGKMFQTEIRHNLLFVHKLFSIALFQLVVLQAYVQDMVFVRMVDRVYVNLAMTPIHIVQNVCR